MSSWYLYSDDGQHLGPVPTEYVARAVKSGALPLDRWVTEADRTAWRPIQDVPEIAALVRAMTPLGAGRDRETTIIATTEAFPTYAPSTQKVPSSDRDADSSERTLIAPAAFEREMAEIDASAEHEAPRRPAAGMPAGSGRQGGFPPVAAGAEFQDPSTLRSSHSPHDPFGSTLRSPDVPEGIVGRPIPPVLDRASGAPAVPPQAMTPSGAPAACPVPPAVAEPRPARNGPVIAFFLGGLALGAIVVVGMLIWAFRGGLLSR